MKKEVVVIIVVVVLILIISGVYIFYNQSSGMPNENNLENNVGVTGLDINIKNFEYVPKTLTIKVGETVTWTNMDSIRHTVTSDEGNELDSALLSQDEIYAHTFNTAGTYKYHCTPHPFMKGEIVVTE